MDTTSQINKSQAIIAENDGNGFIDLFPYGSSMKPSHEEKHVESGEYLKSAIYGGLDGAINVITVILSGIASNTTPEHILALSVAIIIGDGISMGFGDYLSVESEKGYIEGEFEREQHEVINKPEAEAQEIIQIYEDKGYTLEQSTRLAELYATNNKAFVNIMMLEELGLVVSDTSAVYCGITTFISFLVFGTICLIPYIISSGIIKSDSQQLIATIVVGGVTLFSLGFMKAYIIGLSKFKSGFEALILGTIATGIGYGVGYALQ